MKTKLFLFVFALFAVIAPMSAQTFWNGTSATNWTGSGTEADPYLITTAEQLAGIATEVKTGNEFEGKYITLANDLYLSDPEDEPENKFLWTPIGYIDIVFDGFNMIKNDTLAFKGKFDGGGHTVYNAIFTSDTIDLSNWGDILDLEGIDASGWNRGFFGYIEDASIKDLNLADVVITGNAATGGFVCINQGGTISNCSISGLVAASDGSGSGSSGGFVSINNGTIENCHAAVIVAGERSVGGFVSINNGVIRNCHATGNVHGTQYSVGGFAGSNAGGTIEYCYATGDISKDSYMYNGSTYQVGGFVGSNAGTAESAGTITGCYATGNVSGSLNHGAAGFVAGNDEYGIITNCYATGNINADLGATFVGVNGVPDLFLIYYPDAPPGPSRIINCFATGNYYSTYGTIGAARGFCSDQSRYAPALTNCSYYTEYSEPDRPYNDGHRNGGSFYMSSLQQMQTQAFVDTLNMVSALFGLSTWEYRPGQLPIPTGIAAANLTDYLEGGTGTEADPWRIGTKQQLENFATYVNKGYDFKDKYVKLEADIALNAPYEEWGTTMPTKWNPIGFRFGVSGSSFLWQFPFSGTFDGDFHEISNMYIDSYAPQIGLFGVITNGAVIKNLGVIDAKIWNRTDGVVGILAGYIGNAADTVSILQCWTSGDVEAAGSVSGASGIVGGTDLNIISIIRNSYSTANIISSTWDGYVAGITYKSGVTFAYDKLENCYFAGTFNAGRNRYPIGSERGLVNCFWDGGTTGIGNDEGNYHWANYEQKSYKTTEEMQSKKMVNVFNYQVAKHNAQGGDQLHYWQYNGDGSNGEYLYPTFTTDVPPITVTYESNGGSYVMPQRLLQGSITLPPPHPAKEGSIFAGWYADAGLTNIFLFDETEINSNTTLYAKWVAPFPAYDVSIFENPFATSFTITNLEQLLGFAVLVNGVEGSIAARDFSGQTVQLGADILVNDTTSWQYFGKYFFGNEWTPIAKGGNVFRQFKGTFNGNGYTISGIYTNFLRDFRNNHIENTGTKGFFGYIGEGGAVSNLGIKASVIYGITYCGGLAGISRGRISNCYSNADVFARDLYAGSLIGINGGVYGENGDTISQCYATGNVFGLYNVGGLVGASIGREISECYATGNVAGTQNVGGLVGYHSGSAINNCYTTGDVNGVDAPQTSARIGGIYKFCGGTSNTNCYATGRLLNNGTEVSGGISGTSCYYESETNNSNARTTALMKQKVTFVDWDFSEIWGRNNEINNGYPYLRWTIDEYVEDDEDLKVTVTFVDDSGNEIPAQEIAIGGKVIKPADPTHPIYTSGQATFGGWYADEEFTLTFNFNNVIVSDTVIYAKWTYNTRTVVFNTNGGSEIPSQTIVVGTIPQRPDDPVREHYTFAGWYSDSGLTTEYNFDTPVSTYSFRLYAKWIADQHTVTFVTNGGNAIAPIQVDYGTTMTAPVPVRLGYAFTGWYGDEALTEAFDFNTLVTQDTTLYADWIEREPLTLPYTNNITTAADVSDWILDRAAWDSNREGQLLFSATGASAELPLIPEGAVGYEITATTYGRGFELHTSPDGVNYTSQGTSSSPMLNTTTIAMPDNTRSVKFVSTGSGVALVSVSIAKPHVSVTAVQLNATTATLTVGETEQLTATVFPETATNQNVRWESDNENIATVDQNGIVTAHAAGTAVIMVFSQENRSIADECVITVSGGSTGIDMSTDKSIRIYPNPVADKLHIENGERKVSRIEIVDLSGKTVYTLPFYGDPIKVSAWANGVYFLKMETPEGVVIKRFIKE